LWTGLDRDEKMASEWSRKWAVGWFVAVCPLAPTGENAPDRWAQAGAGREAEGWRERMWAVP
jgi:hypothetical protein